MAIKVTKVEKKLAYDKKLCSLLDEYRHLIKKGDKVSSSEVAFLAKLGIRSFSYGLVVLSIYDNGSVFSPNLLNSTKDDLIGKFATGVSMVASLSLALSYPTLEVAPWLKEYLKDPCRLASKVPSSVVSAENIVIPDVKEEEKVNPTNGSNDNDLDFSLFD
ncbi:60S acidic ribosomal protein P0-like [Asparagus officinalis]|uniref:60S acidic ribosomal protein P0-like n=1 Tax=Asparagus officinalis TaxID=4686 RepID=UPI00098E64F7|nr:60S acidic ribosomal protein P0-like [Asparagus officinalis]